MVFFHRNLTFVFFVVVNLDMSYSMLLLFFSECASVKSTCSGVLGQNGVWKESMRPLIMGAHVPCLFKKMPMSVQYASYLMLNL